MILVFGLVVLRSFFVLVRMGRFNIGVVLYKEHLIFVVIWLVKIMRVGIVKHVCINIIITSFKEWIVLIGSMLIMEVIFILVCYTHCI